MLSVDFKSAFDAIKNKRTVTLMDMKLELKLIKLVKTAIKITVKAIQTGETYNFSYY